MTLLPINPPGESFSFLTTSIDHAASSKEALFKSMVPPFYRDYQEGPSDGRCGYFTLNA